MASLVMVPRRSHERGHANHGWLQTSHTFAFGKYQDQKHQKYGPLRVLNEDRISPGNGFGEHTHHDYEIFTYIVDGELEHKDSMGNTEVLSRGSIQLTSTGSGISHSEQTHGSSPVQFIQVWAQPSGSSTSPSTSSSLSISSRNSSPSRSSQHHLPPKYYTRHFTDAEKTNTFCRVVAPEWDYGVSRERTLKEGTKSSAAPIKSDLRVYASLLEKGKKVNRELSGRKAYLHVVQRKQPGEVSKGAKVRVWGTHGFEELELTEGDGVYVAVIALQCGPGKERGEIWVENVSQGEDVAEVLLFDME